jgi:hypothetical protein
VTGATSFQTAGVSDTLAVLRDVVLPTFAKGVMIRRPKVVELAERLDTDARTVRRMQRLRAAYGDDPVYLKIPGRSHLVLLSARHVHEILEGAPEPFSPCTLEKRAALGHFEPGVSLISRGSDRRERRRFNEAVLDFGCPVHRLAEPLLSAVEKEVVSLVEASDVRLDWDTFHARWGRIVRRVVLGAAAAGDEALTDDLDTLRSVGNWAFFHSGKPATLKRFHHRVAEHLARAEPGSLAETIGGMDQPDRLAVTHQVAHYIFAFDAGALATFRALAVLATHPVHAEKAAREATSGDVQTRTRLPYLRACLLESLRLWPTTPAILRETTREAELGGRKVAGKTNVMIFAPFFHRDDETLPYAHRFSPEIWLAGEQDSGRALVPFSGGPGLCPAHRFVPMISSALMAGLLARRTISLSGSKPLHPDRDLPGTLSPFGLRLSLA